MNIKLISIVATVLAVLIAIMLFMQKGNYISQAQSHYEETTSKSFKGSSQLLGFVNSGIEQNRDLWALASNAIQNVKTAKQMADLESKAFPSTKGSNSISQKTRTFSLTSDLFIVSTFANVSEDPKTQVKTLVDLQSISVDALLGNVAKPATESEEVVEDVYRTAWLSGCKGCTIYRDGSRSGVMISVKKDKKDEEPVMPCKQPEVTEVRPQVLECDVVRFQNNKEKWVAFVGLLNGYPYEIFTGLQDDDEGIVLPKTVVKGKIIKQTDENGKSRYDFQFENKRGYKTTVEGLSEKFNPEYWNYAKLISGVLRYRMPIDHVIKLVGSLQLKSESINTWKNGVERALKKYIVDGTEAKGQECPNCGGKLIYQEGCLICKSCGSSRCG